MVRAEPTNTHAAGIDTNQLKYVQVAARTQCYMWTKVDTVRFAK